MTHWHCTACHHEWDGPADHCDWCSHIGEQLPDLVADQKWRDAIAGSFPRAQTKEALSTWIMDQFLMAESGIALIQRRMLERATQCLIDQGKTPDEARAMATDALKSPPMFPLPTIEELDGSRAMTVDANTPDDLLDEFLFGDGDTKALRMDIDWSDCSQVRSHPDFLGGALAMVSAPRMPVAAIIANYNAGYSAERIAAMFPGVQVDHVQAIIAYAATRR